MIVSKAMPSDEVLGLVARIVGEALEDIDSYVIITQGKCADCAERNGIGVIHNCKYLGDLKNLIEAGVLSISESVLTGEIFVKSEAKLYVG